MGSVQLMHSIRDRDIPYHQTEMICQRIFGEGKAPGFHDGNEAALQCIDGSNGAAVLDVQAQGRPRFTFEIIEYGGKSRISKPRSITML